MDETKNNPFSSTRAADFTDRQINDYWVDLDKGGGFFELLKPRSEMPMIILGGKGTGKTHLLRYLSFPLQKIRHEGDLLTGIADEGYLGVYMRCSGLNSARFRNKGQPAETWATVFSYYTELWLSQLMLGVTHQLVELFENRADLEKQIALKSVRLFDDLGETKPTTLKELSEYIQHLQREMDIAINNCALVGRLEFKIRATPGNLVFGIPKVVAECIEALAECNFVYLIDEFENLTSDQQKFINTLVREKKPPCSIKIGSKLHGIKTYSTDCDGEENREGSEFETLPLDDRLRNSKRYKDFANTLVMKRLVNGGVIQEYPSSSESYVRFLESAFEQPSTDELVGSHTKFIFEKYKNRERPYFRTLTNVLIKGVKSGSVLGLTSDEIPTVIKLLSCFEYPLLEKLNCFMLYQKWSANQHLLDAAKEIQIQCKSFCLKQENGHYYDKLRHFKYDLLAQMYRECEKKQVYAGFSTLIELSWGNPRHLLMLLKHVFAWALFKGEKPFRSDAISETAQIAGVQEAAEWFYRDPRIPGKDGVLVRDAIQRLATLFRSIRYSHKPSECSLCSFSYEPATISNESRRIIDIAEKHSLLVPQNRGQRDRNSERVDEKTQINRLLSPIWDIAYFRRGVIPLSGHDVNSIFDLNYSNKFDEMLSKRVARMTAPFFGRQPRFKKEENTSQRTLPGIEND